MGVDHDHVREVDADGAARARKQADRSELDRPGQAAGVRGTTEGLAALDRAAVHADGDAGCRIDRSERDDATAGRGEGCSQVLGAREFEGSSIVFEHELEAAKVPDADSRKVIGDRLARLDARRSVHAQVGPADRGLRRR